MTRRRPAPRGGDAYGSGEAYMRRGGDQVRRISRGTSALGLHDVGDFLDRGWSRKMQFWSIHPGMSAVVRMRDQRLVDVLMVQCWLFGLELCAGASFDAFLELLEEWPVTYRPPACA